MYSFDMLIHCDDFVLQFTGSGRKYQLYAIHTSKACNILSKYTAFIPIDLDTNEYLQTCIEYINGGKSYRSVGNLYITHSSILTYLNGTLTANKTWSDLFRLNLLCL